jgi:hypothetical protein
MRRLRNFWRLPSRDRQLLVRAVLLLGAIRLGLSLLPFPTVRRLVAGGAQVPTEPQRPPPASVDRLVWAVTVASRYVPKATCLTQALAAQVLLARQGYPAQLRVGVARGGAGGIEAHAWLESRDKVVIGGSELGRYVPLPAFDEAGRKR